MGPQLFGNMQPYILVRYGTLSLFSIYVCKWLLKVRARNNNLILVIKINNLFRFTCSSCFPTACSIATCFTALISTVWHLALALSCLVIIKTSVSLSVFVCTRFINYISWYELRALGEKYQKLTPVS